jgi:dihydrofolate reductase
MKEVIIVVAAAEDGAMGLAGDLPWHLPDDFKHFKQTTSGYPIIMGRKTLESFPKALPNRDHIVVTRNTDYVPPFEIFGITHSIESALRTASIKHSIHRWRRRNLQTSYSLSDKNDHH